MLEVKDIQDIINKLEELMPPPSPSDKQERARQNFRYHLLDAQQSLHNVIIYLES